MLNVIPAPHAFAPDDSGNLELAAGVRIDAAEGTELAANWLRRGLERFSSVAVIDSADVAISLAIGEVTVPEVATTGVHPDGSDIGNENHSITISTESIAVTGVSAEAVFRGATTVLQVLSQATTFALGTITDAPHLAWRGLSFDTVRCFHSVETVKQVLDLLALYKMNVLHFHLTDTEGWRFQVDEWPKLTEISGQTARDGRPGGFYKTAEFAEIVQYAADRYILVVPEFDSPGHTASVLAAYPELGSDEIRTTDPAMHYLHPDQPGVSDLLRDVYTAMATQTSANYIHIGGDEAIAMEHEVFQQYIQMAAPLARATGKRIVAWQEAARGGLAAGDLVQSWIPDVMVKDIQQRIANPTEEDLARAESDPVFRAFAELFSTADQDIPMALEQGANVIVSPATQLYLDTKYIEPSAEENQEPLRERLGLPQSVYQQGTVEDSYNWQPESILPGVPADRIVGVEAAIWCETITGTEDLFFQLLPRLAGSAEKAWSNPREWEDHRQRLAQQPIFWEAMGLTWFKSSLVW